ncbi:MAG: phosphoribosyltransferase [Pseudomonadota bacterium]
MEPHDFWQGFHQPEQGCGPPFTERYPAALPDGRILFLPIRPLHGAKHAIASLNLPQCSFEVEDALAAILAARLAPSAPDIVVGIPTLGLSLARNVAARLGHTRYVALGTSPKFWYDDALSVPLRSITSPTAEKKLFLDPRVRPLLADRRVCLVDDVISSGRSILAALDLLSKIGVTPVSVGTAMVQTRRWSAALSAKDKEGASRLFWAIESPLLLRASGGWEVNAGV